MRLSEFRKNKGLVDEIVKLFDTNDWKYLRGALDQEHPIHLNPGDSSPGALARHLGEIQGYQHCLNLLDSARILIQQKPLPVETFEPIKPTEQTKL